MARQIIISDAIHAFKHLATILLLFHFIMAYRRHHETNYHRAVAGNIENAYALAKKVLEMPRISLHARAEPVYTKISTVNEMKKSIGMLAIGARMKYKLYQWAAHRWCSRTFASFWWARKPATSYHDDGCSMADSIVVPPRQCLADSSRPCHDFGLFSPLLPYLPEDKAMTTPPWSLDDDFLGPW